MKSKLEYDYFQVKITPDGSQICIFLEKNRRFERKNAHFENKNPPFRKKKDRFVITIFAVWYTALWIDLIRPVSGSCLNMNLTVRIGI